MLRSRIAMLLAAGAMLGGFSISSAAAVEPTPAGSDTSLARLQQRIDYQLRLLPGGRQIGPNKISWDKQGVTMEFAMPGQTINATNCVYRHACLYGDVDWNNGPDHTPWQLSFYYCTDRDLGDWGVRNQTSSVVNNQTTGTVTSVHEFRNEARPGDGIIQLWLAAAYYADPWIGGPANDRADWINPC